MGSRGRLPPCGVEGQSPSPPEAALKKRHVKKKRRERNPKVKAQTPSGPPAGGEAQPSRRQKVAPFAAAAQSRGSCETAAPTPQRPRAKALNQQKPTGKKRRQKNLTEKRAAKAPTERPSRKESGKKRRQKDPAEKRAAKNHPAEETKHHPKMHPPISQI